MDMDSFIDASELNSFFQNSTDQAVLTSHLHDFFCSDSVPGTSIVIEFC